MNSSIINILCFLMLINYISTSNKFYDRCREIGTCKTYAIDYIYGTCIEFCIYPRQYWFYKVLEATLTYAFNNNPCETLGYNRFEGYEVRSYLGLGTYVDKYKIN